MAAPTYTTDLTDIDDGSGTFTEPTSAVLGTLTNADVDNFVQGTNASTKSTGASGAPALAGIGILDAGAHTITSPNAFYCWVFVGAGALIDTYANGGIRLLIGNTSANYRYWYVDGNNFFPYIGWQCIAIETDNAVVAADGSIGTPTATKQYFGAIFNCLINIGKGNPMAVDALRWGRTITILNADLANGYATFAGCATTNDAIGARWGQFQAISGGYQLQGKLLLGTTGSTIVDFRDSNKSIAIAVSRKTATSFNAIEIQNTSSRVDWDSCVFTALGTNSRGTVTVTDNADVNISSCSFTGMDTFSFLAATDVLDSTFRGCNAITAAGSNMTGTQVLVPTVAADASALIWNVTTDTDGKLDNMTFSKGTNAHHAIQFGASADPVSNTLRGITFTGFNAANGSNDSALYFSDTGANVTWTVNLIGCSGTISYKKVRAGDTVSLVSNPVTLSIHVQDIDTAAAIVGARVYIPVTSTASGRPYNQTINSITRSSSTATVTFAANHNLATNDYLKISGCDQPEYNQAFQATVTGLTTLTVTVSGTPASGSGTMVGTWVIINNVTDGSGNISASYTYSASQPISGWARLASGAGPYYKTAPISGTVDSTSGLSVTVQLIPDS